MKHVKFKSLILLSLWVLLISGIVWAGPRKPAVVQGDYNSIKDYLTEYVQKEMAKHKVTGLSMALVEGDRTVFSGNFGYADRERKLPVTEETVFRVGSVSKLFTATAIMQLSEEGKLDIDQPLQNYIPEFSIRTRFPNAGPITIRSIMTHHSGLPGDRFKDFTSSNPPYFTSLVDEMKDEYTAYPPNTIFGYSNLGMSLLGVVVERVSGEKFSNYVDEHIINPMAMKHSSFQLREDIQALFAKGYSGGKPVDEGSLRDIPAGGLYANVQDLSRFMAMVLAGGRSDGREILKGSTLAAMLTPQNENIPLDLNFKIGLNWMLSDPELEYAGKIAQHGGDTELYHSMLELLPDHDLGVVVLTNSDSGAEIAGEIARKALKLALEVKAGIKEPAEPQLPAITKGFTEEERAWLAGDYATGEGLTVIGKTGAGLRMTVSGRKFKMIPREDGWFSIRPMVLGFIPWHVKALDETLLAVRDIQGRKVLIISYKGNQMAVGETLEPLPISEVWRGRAGLYRFTEPQTVIPIDSVRIKADEHWLLAEFLDGKGKNQGALVLTPVNENEAIVRGLGRSMHETLQVVRVQDEEVMVYSGLRLKRVR